MRRAPVVKETAPATESQVSRCIKSRGSMHSRVSIGLLHKDEGRSISRRERSNFRRSFSPLNTGAQKRESSRHCRRLSKEESAHLLRMCRLCFRIMTRWSLWLTITSAPSFEPRIRASTHTPRDTHALGPNMISLR